MTEEQSRLISDLALKKSGQMIKYAARLTGDEVLAEDLVQEVFSLLCENINKLDRHKHLEGWLYQALYFFTLRALARAYRKDVFIDPDTVPASLEPNLPMESYLPEGLNDKEREILLLRIREGMTYAQIAEAKGLSESACRQQYARARRKCQLLLSGEEAAEKIF